MVRASLISALVGVVLGDASGFLATVPATLATQDYSRDAERAADAFAAQLLDQSGVSPSVMVAFFERIRQQEQADQDDDGAALPIAISSHPDHDERIRFFREWRAQPARP
jgi:predicted Zn-dependent protease